MNHDFHQILSQTGAHRPSVIFVRLQSLNAAAAADLIENVCGATQEYLASGAAVTVNARAFRLKRLPLIRDVS